MYYSLAKICPLQKYTYIQYTSFAAFSCRRAFYKSVDVCTCTYLHPFSKYVCILIRVLNAHIHWQLCLPIECEGLLSSYHRQSLMSLHVTSNATIAISIACCMHVYLHVSINAWHHSSVVDNNNIIYQTIIEHMLSVAVKRGGGV